MNPLEHLIHTQGGVSHISDDQSNRIFGQRAAISASQCKSV